MKRIMRVAVPSDEWNEVLIDLEKDWSSIRNEYVGLEKALKDYVDKALDRDWITRCYPWEQLVQYCLQVTADVRDNEDARRQFPELHDFLVRHFSSDLPA